jgi:hypothetical protein
MRSAVAVAAVAALVAAAPPAGGASYPKVGQLVVFRDGSATQRSASTKATTIRVGGRDCTTGSRTALSALVRIKPPKLRIRDYGSCSKRARDGAGLFVRAIGPDANRGFDGWVYKVGQKLATAGAADPSGPFGRGLLKDGQRVTWFFCRLVNASCQRTLVTKAVATAPGEVTVAVRAYDDRGKSVPAGGATLVFGRTTATTDDEGKAVLSFPPGRHSIYAERARDIRSFTEEVDVG